MLHLFVLCLFAVPPPDNLPAALQELTTVWRDESALADKLREKDKEVTEQVEALMHPLPPEGMEPTTLPQPSKEDMQEAQRMVEELRMVYEAALKQYPNNARLHNFYGEWLYDHYGEMPAAIREWHKAIELDKKMSSAYNNLALHNFTYGEYKVGIQQMDLAIKYDKNNPDFLYNLSNVYLAHFPQMGEIRKWDKKKLFREAMKLSEKAAKLSPEDYDILQDYAVNFYAGDNMGVEVDWEEAATAWQATRAIARREDQQFYCWLNEGRVWLRAEKPEKAKACLSEALRIIPTNEVAKHLMESIGGKAEGTEATAPADAPATPVEEAAPVKPSDSASDAKSLKK